MSQHQEQDAARAREAAKDKEQPQPDIAKKITYPEIVSRMFNAVINKNANHQDAKKILIDWAGSLTADERAEFKADKEAIQNVSKRCESAVDLIKQETQYLVHRQEVGS